MQWSGGGVNGKWFGVGSEMGLDWEAGRRETWEGGVGRVANRGEKQGGHKESEKHVDTFWLKHLKRHDLLNEFLGPRTSWNDEVGRCNKTARGPGLASQR